MRIETWVGGLPSETVSYILPVDLKNNAEIHVRASIVERMPAHYDLIWTI